MAQDSSATTTTTVRNLSDLPASHLCTTRKPSEDAASFHSKWDPVENSRYFAELDRLNDQTPWADAGFDPNHPDAWQWECRARERMAASNRNRTRRGVAKHSVQYYSQDRVLTHADGTITKKAGDSDVDDGLVPGLMYSLKKKRGAQLLAELQARTQQREHTTLTEQEREQFYGSCLGRKNRPSEAAVESRDWVSTRVSYMSTRRPTGRAENLTCNNLPFPLPWNDCGKKELPNQTLVRSSRTHDWVLHKRRKPGKKGVVKNKPSDAELLNKSVEVLYCVAEPNGLQHPTFCKTRRREKLSYMYGGRFYPPKNRDHRLREDLQVPCRI
eukprot:gnl/Hemi2/7576_TR2604_c0_g1_i1.p1 gnl/Hemi2/7576_TR2604_c0_g1~~gnl/Hemi2/7576_TR2604_c0_g1_i1.p1  ORF type:complete len:328 (+),score=64.14 gnl/Hemi2/7576_TR2604_c0_g1_i1:110-1093(+)